MINRIKQIRKVLSLSQKQFGEELGISQSQIASYESGHRKLTNRTMKSISEKYGISEEWIRTGQGNMYKNIANGSAILTHREKTLKDVINALDELDDTSLDAILVIVKKMSLNES